jgi:hypothetical protein
MRKTLGVLALMISSMLFLQAPAWAPDEQHHLIKLSPSGSYEALTDCPASSVVRIRPNPAAGAVRARVDKAFKGIKRNRFTFDTSAEFSPVRSGPKRLRATCDNELMINDPGFLDPKVPLAFTGRSLVPQLLLGTGLLLAGAILLVLTGQLPAGVLRRWRPRGPATPS